MTKHLTELGHQQENAYWKIRHIFCKVFSHSMIPGTWRHSKWPTRSSKISAQFHYSGVIIGAMASQITSLTSVHSTVCSGADQRKQQSSASLAFVRGIHRGPVNSPQKWPVTRKMFHLMTSSCERSITNAIYLKWCQCLFQTLDVRGLSISLK